MKYYVGIDLGGTNVRAALVDENGTIHKVLKTASEVNKGPDSVCEKIINLINEVKGAEQISGIGIGFPGPIRDVDNEIMMSTNVPNMAHYPLAKNIEKAFGVPVYLDNDANVAGLAEALVGAGKGKPVVFYATISTGIGGVLVVNGKAVSGKHGFGGEIGNLIIDRNRPKYNHLNAGAIENEASGTAITRKGLNYYPDIKHAGDLFNKAANNEVEAVKIVDEMAYDLAMMFSLISHVCDPDIFVIGGGVMASKDPFLNKMVTNYKSLVHEGMRDVEFVAATLDEPGLVGAAMLCVSRA